MKSYTDLEQSKKLAEFLPLESADMHYERVYFEGKQSDWFVKLGTPIKSDDIIPCWSLAALIEELPDELTTDYGIDYNLTICKEDLQYYLYYHDSWGRAEDIETNYYDDFVDACYEMIIKLHEKKLL